ncbi:M42 family metallopeptidase [uncultured Dubosiella sp.]|uniref:M42 family metallopeptidase n=1 Tax=uncultured Dubosiella sp. TaxID=1937011 RepID=UPI0027308B6B|nr:M42 family peptidase [uncultured Dubosiella sp.]
MEKNTLNLMQELTQIVAISGDEKAVSKALARHYDNLCDEIIYDNLGSIFAVKRCGKPDAKRVMVCAHMDEVGFMITQIHNNGLLSFIKIGNIADEAMYASRIVLKTREGNLLKGSIIAEDEDIKQMKIDLGCASKAEVESLHVRVGDSAVLEGSFTQLNNRILSKAWDDRFGCVLSVELLEALQNVKLDYDLYIGASVMEEVGQRGGTTATGLIHPDMGMVLECSPANDYKGKENEVGQLGKGVLVRYYDKGMMPNRGLLDELVSVCENNQIDYQYYYNMEQTDSAWIHKLFSGCPTLSVCVCARSVHTASSMIDLHDYECAKKAAIKVLSELNVTKIEAFKASNR